MSKPMLPWPGRQSLDYVQEKIDLTGLEEREHDLEAHIAELRKIDEIRKESADLRTNGHFALLRMLGEVFKDKKDKKDDEPTLYQKYKLARVAWQFSRKDDDAKEILAIIDKLKSSFDLEKIEKEERVPVLAAAEAMRAFISVGHHTFSKQTMLAWYFVTREIFTATKPDWCIGGARAGEGGWVTAYSTSHCVRAFSDLAEVLEKSGELLSYLQRVSDHLKAIYSNDIPTEWRKIDKERLARDVTITLSTFSNAVVFDLKERSGMKFIGEDFFDDSSESNYIEKKIKGIAHEALTSLENELGSVIEKLKEIKYDDLNEIESKKDGTRENDKDVHLESVAGHIYALKAFLEGKGLVGEALKNLNEPRWMDSVAKHFFSAARRVRSNLKVCKRYLSSVIDQQVAASAAHENRSWDPRELAYAASTYALIVRRHRGSFEGERLKFAAKLVCNDLSPDGTLSNRIPIHSSGETLFSVDTDELLGAVADLVQLAHLPVYESLADRMLRYFIRQCHYDSDNVLIGWFMEFDHSRSKYKLLPSVDSVESLGALNRMLDEGINNIILDHFSVRKSDPSGLRLDRLFYPDYGFSIAKWKGKDNDNRKNRKSIALRLQDIRAHVERAGGNTLNSIVLHGPGGTGKTMLIETLANTCDVPLVQVTPSDIAKGGEADIEKRSRAVFEALSMLSRVIILFDEFDPILKRRDDSGERDTNIYSFLTPGMLPKLKDLHDNAKKRRVAYALITNLIGTLDVPAIRKGRFDEAVGIYPPDPISRAGYFAYLCTSSSKVSEWKANDAKVALDLNRFTEVVVKTSGLGMTNLTATGYFRFGDKSDLENKPIGYIHKKSVCLGEIGEPEQEFKEDFRGVGQFLEREVLEWGLLHYWDQKLKSKLVRMKNNSQDTSNSSKEKGKLLDEWLWVDELDEEHTRLLNKIQNNAKKRS